MEKSAKIKAAVIGLGVGAHQARSLAAYPHCDLTWLCDLDEARLTSLGSELPQARLTQAEQDVLTDPEVDLVCVASYDEAHARQVITALEHGKHVYVEKPMCLTRGEALNIRKALKARPSLRLSSNLVLRTCPLFSKVRQAVNSQQLGTVYYLEGDYLWGRREKIISGWRAEAGFYSIIHGAAVHMVDLILWIIGKRPTTVQAMGNRIVAAETPQKHNDFAVLLLGFEDQAIARISAHGGCVHPHFHSLKVFGTKRSFIHESTGTVWVETSDPDQAFRVENAAYPAKERRSQALESFVDSLLGPETTPLVSEEDVFDVMSVCLAAELSKDSEQKVRIEYI